MFPQPVIEFAQKLLLKMNKAILVKGHDSSALIKMNQAVTELGRGCVVYIFTFPKTPFFSCCDTIVGNTLSCH